MTPQHTLPVAIGGKTTLPNGTVIEILGVHNGQVGLVVTEATVSTVKRKRNGNGHKPDAASYEPGSWEYWLHYKRKSWAGWFRKYQTVTDWLLANPGGVAGRVLAGAELRPTYYRKPGRDGKSLYCWTFRGRESLFEHEIELSQEDFFGYR